MAVFFNSLTKRFVLTCKAHENAIWSVPHCLHLVGCVFFQGIHLFLVFPSFWTPFPVFLLLQENEEA